MTNKNKELIKSFVRAHVSHDIEEVVDAKVEGNTTTINTIIKYLYSDALDEELRTTGKAKGIEVVKHGTTYTYPDCEEDTTTLRLVSIVLDGL